MAFNHLHHLQKLVSEKVQKWFVCVQFQGCKVASIFNQHSFWETCMIVFVTGIVWSPFCDGVPFQIDNSASYSWNWKQKSGLLRASFDPIQNETTKPKSHRGIFFWLSVGPKVILTMNTDFSSRVFTFLIAHCWLNLNFNHWDMLLLVEHVELPTKKAQWIDHSSYFLFISHILHILNVWFIHLHLGHLGSLGGKCRFIHHTLKA